MPRKTITPYYLNIVSDKYTYTNWSDETKRMM